MVIRMTVLKKMYFYILFFYCSVMRCYTVLCVFKKKVYFMRQHKMLKSKNEIQPFTVEYAPELIVLRAEFSDFRNKHTAWRLHKKRDVSFSFDDG